MQKHIFEGGYLSRNFVDKLGHLSISATWKVGPFRETATPIQFQSFQWRPEWELIMISFLCVNNLLYHQFLSGLSNAKTTTRITRALSNLCSPRAISQFWKPSTLRFTVHHSTSFDITPTLQSHTNYTDSVRLHPRMNHEVCDMSP